MVEYCANDHAAIMYQCIWIQSCRWIDKWIYIFQGCYLCDLFKITISISDQQFWGEIKTDWWSRMNTILKIININKN